MVGAREDYFFRLDMVMETAKLYGTEAIFAEGQGHDLMLETGWQKTADSIVAWLSSKGL